MKNRKAKKDIKLSNGKRQYIVTMSCTLIAIMLIVNFTFLSFYIIARRDAVTIGERTVAQQSEELNNFLLKGLDVMEVTKINVEYMMKNGAGSEEIQDFLLQQTEDYAAQIDEDFTGIYGLFNGEYLDGIGWAPGEDYDPTTRPWYSAAIEAKGDAVVVAPYLDAQTNSIMISVSQMLYDGESVISLDMVMDGMQELAENISLDGDGYGFIVDDTGLIVAHSDEKEKGKNYLTDEDMLDTDLQEIVREVVKGKEETISIRIDGADSRVFTKSVSDNWHVVMIVNVHDLFQKVEMNLVINILLSLVIFVVMTYFCRSNYKNRNMAMQYAKELKDYQETLEERVGEQTLEIRTQANKMMKMQEDTVEGMATLIESCDGNTGEHVRSTKKYVSMILEYMQRNEMHPDAITKSYVKNMSNAATLHDVGKIKISDVILNKPGRFTPEEYEVMKTHAPIGGEIVKDILGENADEELVQIASEVACYHHEKWDGSGYPNGLKGEDIPLCARIMAVADVFDALVSERVYKSAMSIDEAMDILQKDAGSHFDPEIVDIFLKLRPKVEEYIAASHMKI